MQKKLAGPIEKVALARVHAGRNFEFIGSGHEFAVFFFDLAEQVVKFSRVFLLQKSLRNLPGIDEPIHLKICERQVVTVIVSRRIDP